MNVVLVFPKRWINVVKKEVARLAHRQPCFFMFPVDDETLLSPKKSQSSITRGIGAEGVNVICWLLPTCMASGKSVKKWPDMITKVSGHILVQSVAFADRPEELRAFLDLSTENKNRFQGTNITCQYQPPYTTMFEKWVRAGAKGFHPCDYFKDEFLYEISKFQGIWVYFGHALADRLRGYGHVYANELLLHQPKHQLEATLWFTCSTLADKKEKGIALHWYLSGATKCLLASPEAVKTNDNQLLGEAWLAEINGDTGKSIATILHALAITSTSIEKRLKKFKLMGSPWVTMNM